MGSRSRRTMGLVAAVAVPLALLSTIAASRPHRWAHRWHRPWGWSRPAIGEGHGVWVSSLTVADGARLRPGQYIWQGDSSSMLPASVAVDLGRQLAYVYQGYRLVGISTVSSGRRGYETPAGIFPILQKAVWHRSTIYSGAPMPFMERLTWGGVALHAGGVPGYRQSHGCIHLPPRFAQLLYGITSLGAIVAVSHGTPAAAPPPPPALIPVGAFPTTEQAVESMTTML